MLRSLNQFFVQNIQISNGIFVEDVFIDATTFDKNIFLNLNVNSSQLANVAIENNINWEDDLEINFNKFSIVNDYVNWMNKENFNATIDGQNLSLDNFNLASNEQLIYSKKIEKKSDDLTLDLSIENLIVKEILDNLDPELEINGVLNLNAVAELKNNILKADLGMQLNEISLKLENFVRPLNVDQLTISANYDDQAFNLNNTIRYKEKETNLDVQLPLVIDFKEGNFGVLENDSLFVVLGINDFDLDFINYFLPSDNDFQAKMNADFKTTGTLISPMIDGTINLLSGSFTNSSWGVLLENIVSNISFEHAENKNIISIDKFYFDSPRGRSSRGTFNLNGFSTIVVNDLYDKEKSFVEISHTNVGLNINNLQVTDSKAIKSNISGNITAYDVQRQERQGERKLISIPNFLLFGRMNTNEVRVNIDELLKINTLVTVAEPMLVTAQRKPEEIVVVQAQSETPFRMPDIDTNIQIELPRNVWISGRDMNFELNGNANIRSVQNNYTVNGSVSLNRGYYQFFGKRFNIEEGTVSFTGHELDNPAIDLKANYAFRNALGDKKTITLQMGGNLQSPEIQFYLDDAEILEHEAISYIVFGRTIDEMSSSEEAVVGSMIQENATAMGYGMLTNQISNMLAQQLRLDMMEIKQAGAAEDWQQASITIGRYIGNNIFISYENSFDFSDLKALDSQKINVEYQLNKNIFFNTTQGSTNQNGFDVIFKWQKNENSASRY
jgi:translocation and assembly module TamB